MYERLSGYSGAVLGYMHGNIRGAVGGYYAGRALYRQTRPKKVSPMAPYKRRGSVLVSTKPKKWKPYGKSKSANIRGVKWTQPKTFGRTRILRTKGNRIAKRRGGSRRFGAQPRMAKSGHNDMLVRSIRNKLSAKRMKRNPATFRYSESKQLINETADGIQGVFTLQFLATTAQLSGNFISGLGARNSYSTWEINPYALNPFVNTLQTSTLYPGPLPAITANDMIALLSCKHTLNMLSLENIPQHVHVRWCVATKNGQLSPDAVWLNELNAKNMTQTGQATANTIADNTTARGGAQTLQDVGVDPEEVPGFKKWWRVIADYNVVLQPGDQHSVTTTFRWNRKITKLLIDNMNAAETFIGGITIVPLVVVRAGLVGIKLTAGGSTAAEVTYGPTKVGFLQSNEWLFGALPINRLSTNRTFRGYLVNADTVTQDEVIIGDEDTAIPTIDA